MPVGLQEDIFTVQCIHLGKLNKLKIRHDNSGLKTAWYLDRVEVEDKIEDCTRVFPCNRWLATSEDDGQICRELVPVEESALKLERKRTLQRKNTVSSVDGLHLEAKGKGGREDGLPSPGHTLNPSLTASETFEVITKVNCLLYWFGLAVKYGLSVFNYMRYVYIYKITSILRAI